MVKEIVDEFETIADAFTSTNAFIFDEIGAINMDRDITYPAILVNARNIDTDVVRYRKNDHLPITKEYVFNFLFLDDYPESESSTNLQDKYDNLELIAEQYFAEVKRRQEASGDFKNGITVGNPANGFFANNVHNDRLVQLSYTLTIQATEENCTVGTFSY